MRLYVEREEDKSMTAPMSREKAKSDLKGVALGQIMAGYINITLSWDNIPWLCKYSNLPIILKGVQTSMVLREHLILELMVLCKVTIEVGV